jgi:hypothetical protein
MASDLRNCWSSFLDSAGKDASLASNKVGGSGRSTSARAVRLTSTFAGSSLALSDAGARSHSGRRAHYFAWHVDAATASSEAEPWDAWVGSARPDGTEPGPGKKGSQGPGGSLLSRRASWASPYSVARRGTEHGETATGRLVRRDAEEALTALKPVRRGGAGSSRGRPARSGGRRPGSARR